MLKRILLACALAFAPGFLSAQTNPNYASAVGVTVTTTAQQLPTAQSPNGWFGENNGAVTVYIYPTSNGLPTGTCAAAAPATAWTLYANGDKWSTSTPTLASWCAIAASSTANLALQGN